MSRGNLVVMCEDGHAFHAVEGSHFERQAREIVSEGETLIIPSDECYECRVADGETTGVTTSFQLHRQPDLDLTRLEGILIDGQPVFV